ncbi:hypothetical protein CYFUS_004951 [Cystobacter fuscus]|uniref:DUF6484 domain-containing protein n=1 Tax=Cystobacter fuscus TaxID=43 RepID=A0A250J7L0_9BACT|nr:DUF6484 domain-containing protein [Cystobacter fuscus]ATB39507.1 hypothetical protein CYFUS_004951 [Cystobacter fuscus]
MGARQEEQSTRAPDVEERIREPRRGWVVRVEAGHQVWVDYPGNVRGPLKARTSATLDLDALKLLPPVWPEALLLFADGDPAQPVLLMLLEPTSNTPLTDALLAQPLSRVPAEARVDGERVVITGRKEVVLECGKASLTLRRDGTVVLRGVNLVSEAEEVHRIRGRKVRIN